MKNRASKQDLGDHIERLVDDHITASRAVAREALERAFASAARTPCRARSSQSMKPPNGKRRTREEIAAVGERLYQAVCASPGETMVVLGTEVGGSAAELNRPMTLLKQAGRVRSVGSRSRTRYFPMADVAETAA